MKVLLTGAKGQLGCCFQHIFPNDWQLITVDRSELDITNQNAVESFIQLHRPDVVVNAAAYTAVDKAESEIQTAEQVNAQGPYYLALASKLVDARFIHISTDYVFDGTKNTPYQEIDKTSPLSVYGKTKLKGEQLSQQANSNTIIIRTSWVFSEHGHNFVRTMLRLAKERDELNIVNDQVGCPTYAGDLALCIIGLIKQNSAAGIYHYAGDKILSWFEFSKQIVNCAYELGYLANKPVIQPILTEQYKTPAIRPKNSSLDCSKIKKEYIVPHHFYDSLIRVIDMLVKQNNCQ